MGVKIGGSGDGTDPTADCDDACPGLAAETAARIAGDALLALAIEEEQERAETAEAALAAQIVAARDEFLILALVLSGGS